VTEAAIAEDHLSEEEHAGKGVTFINMLLLSKTRKFESHAVLCGS